MVKLDTLSENLDTGSHANEFDFDKRMDSLGEFHNIGNAREKVAGENEFDNRIADNEEEWSLVDFLDLCELDDVMQLFEPDIFKYLSEEHKSGVMDKFRDKVAEELQLENPPEIITDALEDEATHGCYDPALNIVVINTAIMQDGAQVRMTLAHEIRHAWQYERAALPEESQTAFDKALKENFNNYISPKDNYRAYRSQLVEMDAREYANGLVEDMYFSQVQEGFNEQSE